MNFKYLLKAVSFKIEYLFHQFFFAGNVFEWI